MEEEERIFLEKCQSIVDEELEKYCSVTLGQVQELTSSVRSEIHRVLEIDGRHDVASRVYYALLLNAVLNIWLQDIQEDGDLDPFQLGMYVRKKGGPIGVLHYMVNEVLNIRMKE